MGTTLTGKTIASTYTSLLKVSDNSNVGSSIIRISDGAGNDSSVYLSSTQLLFSAGSVSVPGLSINGTATTGLYAPNDNEIGITISGTQRGLFTSSGLSVTGYLKVTGAMYDSNDSAGTSNQVLTSTGTATDWKTLSEIAGVDGSGNANYLSKWSDANTITDSILYEDSAKIGINNTSPQSVLDLGVTSTNSQVLNIRTNSNSRIGFGVNASYGMRQYGPSDIGATNQLFQWGTIASSDGTTYSDLMNLLTNGNLGLGVTTPSSTIGYAKVLEIKGASSGIAFSTTSYNNFEIGTGSDSTLSISDGGSVRMSISSDGTTTFGVAGEVVKVLPSSGQARFLIESPSVNGNNVYLALKGPDTEWRWITNRGDLNSGNQGDLFLREETAGVNVLNFETNNGNATFAGSLKVSTIAEIGSDTDKFLMSDSGLVKYVSGANLLSYIGAAPSTGGAYLPLAGGTMTGSAIFNAINTFNTPSGGVAFNIDAYTDNYGTIRFRTNGNANMWDVGIKSDNDFYIYNQSTSEQAFEIDISNNNATFNGETTTISGDSAYYPLIINHGADITPHAGGRGQIRINGSGYVGIIALDGTAMYVGHNSSSRDLVLQTNTVDRLTINGSTGAATFAGAETYHKIQTYYAGDYTSGFKFSDYNGGIWYDAGTDDLTLNAGHANSQMLLNSGGAIALTLDASQNATFAGAVSANKRLLVTTDGTYAYGINVSSSDQSHARIRITNTGSGGETYSMMVGTHGANNTGFAIRNETDSTTPLQFDTNDNATVAGDVTLATTKKLYLASDTYLFEQSADRFQIYVGGVEYLDIDQDALYTTLGSTVTNNKTNLLGGGSASITIGDGSNNAYVGINDTSPSYGLDVNGTMGVSGNATFAGAVGVNGGITSGYELSVTGDVRVSQTMDIYGAVYVDASISTTGNVTVGADLIIPEYIYHTGNLTTFFGFPSDNTFKIKTNNEDALTIDSSQDATFTGEVAMRTDQGASNNAILRLRGQNTTNRITRLQLEDYKGTLADGLIQFRIPTADTASSAVLEIGVNSAGLTMDHSNNASFAAAVLLADDKKLEFGGGGDLKIYHQAGSNSYIEEHGEGALVFKSNDYYFQSTAAATVLQVIPGAGTITTGYGTFSGIITGQSSSSGDYVRMYGGSGTGKWDIYGSGADLRFSDNEGAGSIRFDTNVGIAIAPLARFHVNLTTNVNFTTTYSGAALRLNAVNDAVDTAIPMEFVGSYYNFTGSGLFYLAGAISSSAGATFAGVLALPDGSVSAPSIGNTGDTNTGIYFPGDHQLGFAVNGSRKFYMSETQGYFQNLSSGISINAGGIDVTGGSSFNSGTTNTVATFTSTDAGANISLTDNSNRSALEQNTADFILSSDPDDSTDNSTIKFQVDGSTKVTILDSGNVGINATPPTTYVSGGEHWDTLQIGRNGVFSAYQTNNEALFGVNTFLNTSGTYEAITASTDGFGIIMQPDDINFSFFHTHATPAQTQYQRMTLKSTGELGIGAPAPLAHLDVNTSGKTAIPALDAVPGASTSAIFRNSGNTVILATGVDNANTSWLQGRQTTGTGSAFPIALNPLGGNVGIGDSAPNTKLEVNGDTTIRREGSESAGELLLGGTTDGGFVDFDGTNLQLNTQRDPNTGTFINTSKSQAGITLTGASADSYIRFYTNDANNSTANERMRITKTGNVGIGDTTPAVKLHIQGAGGAVSPSSYSVIDLAIENSGEAALGIIGTTYSSIYFGDAASATVGGIVYNHSSNIMTFATSNGSASLTLDSGVNATFAGDVTVTGGVTVNSGSNPWAFTSNPSSGNYGGLLLQYGGATKGVCYYNSATVIFGGEANIPTRLQAGGQYAMHIDYTNQNVHIGGTSNASYKLQVTGNAHISTTLNVGGDATFAGTIQGTRLGLGGAPDATAALNITTTNQHMRLNNGSELGVIHLLSSGELEFWAHGDGETINFRTGSGVGALAMHIDGTVSYFHNTVYLSSSGVGVLSWTSGAGNSVGNAMVIGGESGYGISFKGGGSERATMSSTGDWTFAGDVTASSGTGHFSLVNASAYQLNGTYVMDSSRNLVNIGTVTAAGDVTITNGSLTSSQSSTTNPVARFTDTGVANYDWTFPDSSTIQLGTNTTSTKTFKLVNAGSGNFNFEAVDATFAGNVGISSGTPLLTLTDTSSSATSTLTLDGTNLTLQNNGTDGDMIFQNDNGAGGARIYFFLDGSIAASGGLCYTTFPDDSVACWGDSQDLKISHQGSQSYIENGTGNLNITNGAASSNLLLKTTNAMTFWTNTTTKVLQLNSGGSAAFSDDLSVTGALSKGSGSFKIDHPLEDKKDTHHLIHSFIEGPQADLIYRGTVDLVGGTATINIDTEAGMSEGTFVLLNTNIQCFTSNETNWDAVKGKVEGNILTIECQNSSSTATVSWMVVGERQDQHMLDTKWTDENGKVIVEPLKEI